MTQGRANTVQSGHATTQPKSTAVNPAGAARIGVVQGPETVHQPLYEGRGLEAPMAGTCIHHCGSQGKHK